MDKTNLFEVVMYWDALLRSSKCGHTLDSCRDGVDNDLDNYWNGHLETILNQ